MKINEGFFYPPDNGKVVVRDTKQARQVQAAVGAKGNTSHHFTAVVWLMEEEIFSNFPGNFIPITIIIIKC